MLVVYVLALDHVQIQKATQTTDTSQHTGSPIHVESVIVHDWSSVHATWTMIDPESPIREYTWAIGNGHIYIYKPRGGGGGGHLGTEGGRTLVTYFTEEGVFF